MVQEFLKKLNANEKMALWGALIVAVGAILGGGWLSLVGALAVIVIYWLKYSPNTNITWPAPIQLITLGISAIIAVFAVLGALGSLSLLGLGGFFGGTFLLWIVGAIAVLVGAIMMVLGTWKEYQAMPKAAPPAPPAAPPAPPAPPTA